MRKEIAELKHLKGCILGLEMDLTLIERDIIVVTNDIDFLKKMEKDLIFNIQLLRRKNVIAIASEYKRSIEELGRVQSDIKSYTDLKNKLNSDYSEKLKEYKKYMKSFKKLEADIKNQKVILLFDPKRKRKDSEG